MPGPLAETLQAREPGALVSEGAKRWMSQLGKTDGEFSLPSPVCFIWVFNGLGDADPH